MAAPASADVAFCPPGSAAAQCNAPDAVAIDEETGEVFVADTGNRRVNVFDGEGSFLRAFGWDVIPLGAPGDTGTGLETCTQATGCKGGSEGAGAGQFTGNGPNAIAVDNDPLSPSQHAVYVVDLDNFRVQKFTPAGGFVWVIGGGVNKGGGAPSNPGDLCTAEHLANGDLCGIGANSKATGEFFSHFTFRPILVGVGPGGVVYVADGPAKGVSESDGYENRVQTFTASGSFIKEVFLPELILEVATFAVDRTSGDCYVNERPGLVHRYFDCETLLPPVTFPNLFAKALAVDGAGNLFATGNNSGTDIYEYDSSGSPVRTFYGDGTLKGSLISIAPYSSATGDVFVVDGSSPRQVAHIAFPPPGPVILPTAAQLGDGPFAIQQAATKAQPIGSIRATFRTRVNPAGKATDVHFEYVDDAAHQISGFTEAKRAPEDSGDDPSIAPDSGKWVDHEATADVACPQPEVELPEGKCLEPETVYHLRAVAKNEDGEDIGPEATFETLPTIELGPIWATNVGFESARLNAELDPIEVPTSVRFEYVDEATCLKDVAELGVGHCFDQAQGTPEVDFGEGKGMTAGSALARPLLPDTTYRFRYIATSFFGEFEGPTRSFTTLVETLPPKTECPNQAFRIGAAASLPDCRAYELVSPLEKGNGDVDAAGEGTHFGVPVEQATPGGDALAYVSFRAFGDTVSSPLIPQYLTRRDPETGWSSHSLNPPLEGGNLYQGVYQRPLYKGFSDDLCSAWLTQNTDLALVEGAPAGVPNIYRRSNCGGEPYELLTTVAPPGYSREGEEGTNEDEGDTGSKYFPGVGGWSEDQELWAFKAGAALTPEAHVVGVGKSLTCELGSSSAPGAQTTYQWLRNGANISGASTQTYATTAADEGKAIQCRLRAINEENDKNSGGKVGALTTSNPAQVVAPAPATMPPIAPAFIPAPESDAPLVVDGPGGQTLSCDPREDQWGGEPTSFAYQWFRDGFVIAGATGPTYVVAPADLNNASAFQCAIAATNAGGSVTILSANLTTAEPEPEPAAPHPRAFVLDVYRVYAKKGGQLSLVSVAPNGEAVHTHAAVGARGFDAAADGNATDSVVGAVSGNGSRIFFSATTKEPPQPIHQSQAMFVPRGPEGESRLYLRLNPMEPQSEVEEAAPGEFQCEEPEAACSIAISEGIARFIAADANATKALYLEGEDLYEVDISKAIAYEVGSRTQIAGEAIGVMGASADLSRVYLVSEALCSSEPNSEGDAAQAGQPNLYLYEAGDSCVAGEMDFVAGLEEDDVASGDNLSVIDLMPFQRRSRVSGDGLHAAFMSRAQLSEYDNTDANSGEAAAEVYLYDAAEAKLRCVSCDPSGARPQGANVSTPSVPVWVAAQIPGWATQWHPSRVLSEDGKYVFFESYEGLVARDANGKLDVYEWEEAHSKAECGPKGAGAERYVPASGGCLSLISTGTSPADAEFIDASAAGSDVFFRTASSLVGIDYGLVDIYDARVGGGFGFQNPPPPDPECEGEACQSPPAPPARQTPASAAFDGEGDVPRRRACPKGKRQVRRKGKVRCVKPRKSKRNGKGRRSRR